MNAARAGARTFVALALGAELGPRVAARVEWALAGADFRLPEGSGLHLTLAFLGEVARARLGPFVEELARALAGAAAPELRLVATGAFPSFARARVLWAGIEERGAPGRLAACRAAVLAGLARAGFEGELERFTPHVTVARPRGRARVPEAFAELHFGLDWDPAEVALFESRRDPAGSRYEVLARFALVPSG